MTAALTSEQRVQARSALGLGFAPKVSQRNEARPQLGAHSYDVWLGMVAAGLAVECETTAFWTIFRLTRAGADAALEAGESLDPRHFPPIGAH
ncbi:hypothetical protein [Aureimonas phyllosphaerae]|uniref:Uncharacterized protein n=1 Tax=Aureimonas phyllosphaerae TaxID=1166078 RepID=A0A7W6FXA5_9HYPH|nr:hypothetical protein [Aureimonas phyllosphaerae]MBB3937907.1 hypothetical protein [Aureimonas phyllosphaerae]MBB3961920.1 hypothetical protein [Aureimonas phyllosphaerae]SFF54704.1 hypothetical protein SAMN05216566_12547 [Aureimonas phyllosphaerae]